MGIYFIYLGAVFGSSTFIKFFPIASLINLEELLDDVSGIPNLSLSDLFVKASPCKYIRQTWR